MHYACAFRLCGCVLQELIDRGVDLKHFVLTRPEEDDDATPLSSARPSLDYSDGFTRAHSGLSHGSPFTRAHSHADSWLPDSSNITVQPLEIEMDFENLPSLANGQHASMLTPVIEMASKAGAGATEGVLSGTQQMPATPSKTVTFVEKDSAAHAAMPQDNDGRMIHEADREFGG